MAAEQLSSNANTVIISRNPHSGASDQALLVEQLGQELERLGFHPLVMTDVAEVKTKVLGLLASGELRAVVAAGGDGTVSLLANELPLGTPLAILPLGTENLLAKYLQQKSDPVSLAKLIQVGVTVRLDAGRANGKLFLVMASCGFDADVVKRVHAGRRGHIRHWSYAWPIMSAIGQYRFPMIRMWVDEDPEPIAARWAFLFNVPRYAMNLPIMTDANSMDGRLDLCTFRGGNLIRGLYYLLAILTQQHRGWDESHCCRFRRMRIEADGPVPYQLDGDPGGELPLEIQVQPGFLRVVVDGEWIGENKFEV